MYITDPLTNIQIEVKDIKSSLLQAEEFIQISILNSNKVLEKYWRNIFNRLLFQTKKEIVIYLKELYTGIDLYKEDFRQGSFFSHKHTFKGLKLEAEQFSNFFTYTINLTSKTNEITTL